MDAAEALDLSTEDLPEGVVLPKAVTFTDKDGTRKDTFTVPASKGVEYVRDGAVVKAGEYPGSGTVTVSARALPKYSLAAGATTQWAHTFSPDSAPAG